MNTSSSALATAAAGDSSSSRRSNRWKYEVFLSFRGEETRTRLTDHLLIALRKAGIDTFIDYKLKKGENIQRELDREIEGSRIAVVVFSKSYAESRWCLRELSKIMREGKVVCPIFYDVDPSQVSNQSGSFGEAFQKHEKDEDPNEVEQWRRDLMSCADLSGRNLKTTADGREGVFIQNVVGDIIALTKTRDLQTSQSNTLLEYLPPTQMIQLSYSSKSRTSTQDPEREDNLSLAMPTILTLKDHSSWMVASNKNQLIIMIFNNE
ncbi:TMV resistance protein N-like [Pyrus ussuriensis x Pyrus communis]|uniref:ADP-ribosyl cyclase/cyclic ADP-ribose hydrolase n=1 Tax=Pyrus ussuriensis x Pyrus communis TaxID=2448454 RepID=A0A5N5G499_9ROSA|nr:TMV resistance protein N-like [Pyrus ussuriensis x Pyrus communis]